MGELKPQAPAVHLCQVPPPALHRHKGPEGSWAGYQTCILKIFQIIYIQFLLRTVEAFNHTTMESIFLTASDFRSSTNQGPDASGMQTCALAAAPHLSKRVCPPRPSPAFACGSPLLNAQRRPMRAAPLPGSPALGQAISISCC